VKSGVELNGERLKVKGNIVHRIKKIKWFRNK